MDITVYLPDDLGRWAKDASVNLSATLREALIEERQRREVRDIGGDSEVHELYVEDNVSGHTVRLHGKEIAYQDRHGETTIYLTEDGRVFAYSNDAQTLYELDDPANPDYGNPSGLRCHLSDDAVYAAAMAAIGAKAIIDIGAA